MKKTMYETNQQSGILLNANESPYPIASAILAEIKQDLDQIAFERYPSDRAFALCKAYGDYIHVPAENIIAGNGSDELIGLLIGLNISKGGKVYTLDPDFSMYDYYTEMQDGEMVKYAYDMKQSFDVEGFIEYGREQKIDMIILSNPNNPTGRSIPRNDLLKILAAFPRNLVIIDEAYGEFQEESMIPYLDRCHNLVVLRTMSKAFGAAALRCGFLLSCKSTIAQILPYKVPYNVNSLTQCAALRLLEHADEIKERIQEIKTNRDRFYEQVSALQLKDFTLYPSKANFIYGTTSKKSAFLIALQEAGIVIRNYQASDAFRITIGKEEENAKVLAVITSVFQKQEESL